MFKNYRLAVIHFLLIPVGLLGISNSAYAQWDSDQWLESPVSDEVFQNYLGFFTYESDLDFNLKVRERSHEEGIYKERITFQSTSDIAVTADYYRLNSLESIARPHVIVVHGGSASGKDGMYNRVVKGLIRHGVNVLAIDLLHFGERKTGLLTTFKNDDKANNLYNRKSLYLEWVIQTVKDVGRSYDLLTRHYKANPTKIGYLGISRGAELGFIITGVEKRFDAVALAISGHFDRLERGHLAAACPANYVGRISPTPTFLINGRFDSDYDAEKSVKPLQKHFGESTEIHWMDTGHNLPPDEASKIFQWLSKTL
ncbi:MAG: hypothetical protein HOL98_02040 [Gammaproteobacteria bacterium]|jgi:dienelactone hydrolase|nr:hypothetical protein [Gammaproteobacteria bacterium]MBT5202212.1 hypothetical protein [Gammaproteobacteria bacterium]MBT6246651.1 hypothetical protein [Gammaproteobacteria bacterium]